MLVRNRPHPIIPDHEVLRKIGGGAYGEVWLARSVTGALRAVKVVYREDFEDTRGFEREFEGILKFEPMSRDHPALVNILHVGRSPDNVSFYYYVMELGDDVRTGRDINPIEYEPRTLRADNQQATGEPWKISDCIDVGLRLAEALDHLHEGGLAHRDVKPSNIIFVNGKAKLADIGLVAARGQRTFVGTEGFVPPEGPGSAQADIYSLGKVLYEIATGKDRMNFPELPDEMPSGTERKSWLELNRIICEVCEPRISKRKISTAADLAESLRRIQHGKRHRRSGLAVTLTAFVLTGFGAWAWWEVVKDTEWAKRWTASLGTPQPAVGKFRIFSSPQDADVKDANGVLVGTTPTGTLTAKVGEEVAFVLSKPGYLPREVRGRLTRESITDPLPLYGQLQVFCPPRPGDPWVDHLGSSYQPVEDHHVSTNYVTREVWSQFAKAAKVADQAVEFVKFTQNEQDSEVVLTKPETADAFCRWLSAGGIKESFLTDDHEVRPLRDMEFDHPGMSERARKDSLKPFHVRIRQIVYGSLLLTSKPPGAEVYLNNHLVGNTDAPLLVPKVKPGQNQILLVLDGYKPFQKRIPLKEGQAIEETVTMVENKSVVIGRKWENGIHMRFVPVGQELMASIWETRVCDYALFVKESGHAAPHPPKFPQDPDHPVVNVSRDDAQAFCEWLTTRERKEELVSQSYVYRLPTDLEWSLMAGLQEEEGSSPSSRDAQKKPIYPWGPSWPDGKKVGNFADMALAGMPDVPDDRTITGYDDGFPYTAPVGSFPPNNLGIFDLSGNVEEWVEDEYSKLGASVLGVLRGGGWNTYQTENLITGSRNAVSPTCQDSMYGFRVVIAKVPPKTE